MALCLASAAMLCAADGSAKPSAACASPHSIAKDPAKKNAGPASDTASAAGVSPDCAPAMEITIRQQGPNIAHDAPANNSAAALEIPPGLPALRAAFAQKLANARALAARARPIRLFAVPLDSIAPRLLTPGSPFAPKYPAPQPGPRQRRRAQAQTLAKGFRPASGNGIFLPHSGLAAHTAAHAAG